MNSLLKVWINAKKASGAKLVASRVKKKIPAAQHRVTKEYHKGGYEVHFEIFMRSQDWPMAVYELLEHAQSLSRDWHVSGVIEEEAYFISNDVPVPGVTSAHFIMLKKEPNQAPEPTARAAVAHLKR